MRFSLTILSFIFFINVSFAQSKFAVNLIPAELKARASAIVRNEELYVDVKDLNEVIIKIKRVVTIVNESGDDEAGLVIFYDKNRLIKSIKGIIYNENGIPVSKIAEKDFRDGSAVSDASLFEDSRLKRFSPALKNYPYTIEYEYEMRSKQSLILPQWDPCYSAGISVENSSFTVACKADQGLRFKELNNPGKAITNVVNGLKTYKWEIKNIKALRGEPFSPDAEAYLPMVKVAPLNFTYQNVSGSFSNWSEYGKWMNEKLLNGRDIIPAETAEYIKNLVKDISDPKQKAKKIYEYLQQKTRYVSVQIGIGGYQPIPASEVDRVGYGDCKGLSNYMKGLLNVVGIKSYYAIIEAGNYKKSAIPDFASMNQFNHVILCMPFPNDTTWVDCTSKTLPFGYLGDFTDDRAALICTEDGGKLLRTPKLSTQDNKQQRKATFIFNESGSVDVNMTTTFEGSQYDNRASLLNESPTEQLKKLKNIYSMDLVLESFNLTQDKSDKPKTTEEIKFRAANYSSISDGRLFIPINIIDHIGKPPREISNRINPVYINRGYTDQDEIVFTLPLDYKVDTRPKDVNIEKPFGTFKSSVELKDNTAIYKRYVQIKEGSYSPDQYSELVNFYQAISDSDSNRITLVK